MKRSLLCVVLLLIAAFFGSLIGEAAVYFDVLPWLGKYYSVGIPAFDLNLHVVVLTFGFNFRICIAEAVLLLAALLYYPKLSAKFFS